VNTIISYLYRDASNYKVFNEAIVTGKLTLEQIAEILDTLQDGENFIPHQVGLPEKKFDTVTEDDHPWFELHEDAFSVTEAAPTVDITADELYRTFLDCKDRWNPDAPYLWEKHGCAEENDTGLPPKYRCPKCGGFHFGVTAHVTQDWKVDAQGNFAECTCDCVEVIHQPDNEDLWNCINCGFSAAGEEFLVDHRS